MFQTASKIHSLSAQQALCASWRVKGAKVVFTNGCFDLLHLGHIDYLEKARQLGDYLIVGLNDDDSVRRLKGPQRPLLPLEARSRMLAALGFVDAVVPFPEDTPRKLVESLRPEILVKGGDYQLTEIVGHEFVLANGGKVLTIPLVPGYSTTELMKKASQS